jgi:hypothetical protein
MACNRQITTLVPLQACTRLAKLDLSGCNLDDHVKDLQVACPQLADPDSIVFEGLVHELLPSIPPHKQGEAIGWLLGNHSLEDPGMQATLAAAGAIPPLVHMLESANLQVPAASVLDSLACGNASNQAAIAVGVGSHSFCVPKARTPRHASAMAMDPDQAAVLFSDLWVEIWPSLARPRQGSASVRVQRHAPPGGWVDRGRGQP